jgi:hypothetical protein
MVSSGSFAAGSGLMKAPFLFGSFLLRILLISSLLDFL